MIVPTGRRAPGRSSPADPPVTDGDGQLDGEPDGDVLDATAPAPPSPEPGPSGSADAPRRTARAFAETVATRIGLIGVGAVMSVFIARSLRPEGRGGYAVIVAVATSTTMLGYLSIDQAAIALWQRRHPRSAIATNATLLAVLNGTVAAIAAGVVYLLVLADRAPVASPAALVVALASVPGQMAALYLTTIVALDDRLARASRARVAGAGAQAVVLLAFGLGPGLTVDSVVWAWVASVVVPLAVLGPGLRIRPRAASRALMREATKLGLRYHAGRASLYLLWRVDVLLLNGRVPQAAIGVYALAATLAEMAQLTTDAAGQAMLPRQVASADTGGFAAKLARYNLIIGVVTVALPLAGAPFLVPLLYGAEFADAVGLLVVLSPGLVAFAFSRPLSTTFVLLDRSKLVGVLTVGALVANIVLNLVLIPVAGTLGAAVASTAAYGGLGVGYAVAIARTTGVPVRSFLPRGRDVAALGRATGRLVRRRRD